MFSEANLHIRSDWRFASSIVSVEFVVFARRSSIAARLRKMCKMRLMTFSSLSVRSLRGCIQSYTYQ
jgi:hypothetical protein